LDKTFQHGMSFYAKVKLDSFVPNSRLFSFTDGRWHQGRGFDVRVNNRDWNKANAIESDSLTMEVWSRTPRWRHDRIVTSKVIRAGEEEAFLFTYNSKTGKYKIYRNGVLVAEQGARVKMAQAASKGAFSKLIVGGVPWHHHESIDGSITDIRVWSREVTWNTAISGAAPGQDAKESAKEETAEVDSPCIASRKNSWDFVCDKELPVGLADSFGYGNVKSAKKAAEFHKREAIGEVASCGTKISAKAVIYQGKFGDGLTAEYFKMRTHCHQPPFVFGKMPTTVRVDPVIKYTGSEFHAPFNELAVRWTGKLLITQSGLYDFKIAADDGAWLAIDGRILIDLSGCGRHQRQIRTKDGTRQLNKGAHDISVLLQQRTTR